MNKLHALISILIVFSIHVNSQNIEKSTPRGYDTYQTDIPHGKIDSVSYLSETVGTKRKAIIYTPPGYTKKLKYPVLYLLHGIGGDEKEWLNGGQPQHILDNLYADDKIEPMIVVMPNGRAMKDDRAIGNIFDSAKVQAFADFEKDLLKDLVPFIEKKYATYNDAEHRAIAGLSMGGGQALNFGLGNIDKFAWVGGFSSAPNTKEPKQLLPEPENAKKNLSLLWISCGDNDRLITLSKRTHDYLDENDVQHIYFIEPGIHDFKVWKKSLYLFSQLLFKPVDHSMFNENYLTGKSHTAQNPVLWADVPDISMIRVDDTYYMSSTTMHMSPGVPIMKSNDLVNWKIVNYAYDILDDVDALNLKNGRSAYGSGSWASCIRYHMGTYYISTFAGTTGTTYIYSTKNLEKGPWKERSFKPSYHDHSLFFDDDGRIYMIWSVGKLMIAELKDDLSGIIEGSEKVLIENASAPAGTNIMLGAEGSQLFKRNGKYYLFNITWPRGGMRTVVIHRANKITGPYEGRLALQDKGVAQGGLIDTPDGRWFAYLFRDNGSVGRIPYIVPLTWEDDWPVIGIDGKVPMTLDLPANEDLIPGIVNSDEFYRKKGEPSIPLVWQWNHNPDNELWSVTQRKGYLRLTCGRIDTDFLSARNTLTQRTIGPECSGSTSIDVSKMSDGDFAGLALLQKKYGLLGVKFDKGAKSLLMINAESGEAVELEKVPLTQEIIYLKAECDFRDRKDIALFYYSLDGKRWTKIGSQLKMEYTLPHFMGYRFGLFNYATKVTGGYVDFDWFRIDQN